MNACLMVCHSRTKVLQLFIITMLKSIFFLMKSADLDFSSAMYMRIEAM